MRLALSVLTLALLGGCVASPMVDYRSMADRPRKDSWVPYQLTDTTLVIGVFGAPSPTPAGGTPAKPAAKAPVPASAAPSGGKGKGNAAAAAPVAEPAPPAPPQAPEPAAIGGETTLVSPPEAVTDAPAGQVSPLDAAASFAGRAGLSRSSSIPSRCNVRPRAASASRSAPRRWPFPMRA